MTRPNASLRAAFGIAGASIVLAVSGVSILGQAVAAAAMPSSPSSSSASSPAPATTAPVTTPSASPTSAPPVTPFVDCRADAAIDGAVGTGGDPFTARTLILGYRSTATSPVKLTAGGTTNALVPGVADRGQPETFAPGEHHGVWSLTLDAGAPPATWQLGGASALLDGSAPACSTVTTVALSAPSTVAPGGLVSVTAAVSRMQLSAPSTGHVEFRVDAGRAVEVEVDEQGITRTELAAPTAGNHTIEATFVPPAGSDLRPSHAAGDLTVTGAAGPLSVSAAPVASDARRATITVNRASAAGTASVDVVTADGTARAGKEYTATRVTATLADGQRSATVTVPLATRPAGAPAASFFVLLQRATTDVATAGATVSLPGVAAATAPSATLPGASVGGSGTGHDSVLPAADPTGSAPAANVGNDFILMLGAALLTAGGILGVVGLVRFGGSRNAAT